MRNARQGAADSAEPFATIYIHTSVPFDLQRFEKLYTGTSCASLRAFFNDSLNDTSLHYQSSESLRCILPRWQILNLTRTSYSDLCRYFLFDKINPYESKPFRNEIIEQFPNNRQPHKARSQLETLTRARARAHQGNGKDRVARDFVRRARKVRDSLWHTLHIRARGRRLPRGGLLCKLAGARLASFCISPDAAPISAMTLIRVARPGFGNPARPPRGNPERGRSEPRARTRNYDIPRDRGDGSRENQQKCRF